jgi:PKD repeat protein
MLVNFKSTSKSGDSEITNVMWDFRNGDFREGASVQYSYGSAGQFDVILKVTDNNGCYSQLESEKKITLANKPRPDFTASDTFACAPPLNVSFTNLSNGSSELTYKWDFGNGRTSTEISYWQL